MECFLDPRPLPFSLSLSLRSVIEVSYEESLGMHTRATHPPRGEIFKLVGIGMEEGEERVHWLVREREEDLSYAEEMGERLRGADLGRKKDPF